MTSKRTDSIGRRSRSKAISTGKRVTPQARDLLWFAKLAEHGPLPTSFLIAYAKGTHKSPKRAQERLTDLFNEADTPHGGAYLTRPAQQFRTLDSRYNQLVYDLAPAALVALKRNGMTVDPVRSGPWLHSFMVSCITASVELACRDRTDVKFIPQSAILTRANTSLRWSVELSDPGTGAIYSKDLIPDAVFGLEYVTEQGSRFRFYALEADRATEPTTSSTFHRKSFERHLLQYAQYIEAGEYREHLKLTAPMLVLNVTTSEARAARMMTLTGEHFPEGNNYQLFAIWDAFSTPFTPPVPKPDLLTGNWHRQGFQPIELISCS